MTEDLLKNEQFIRLSALVSAFMTNLKVNNIITFEQYDEILDVADRLSKDVIDKLKYK